MSKSDPIPPMSEEVKQFIRALNRLVVLYESNPTIPVPSFFAPNAFVKSREELDSVLRKLKRFKQSSHVGETYYRVEVELSALHSLSICVPKEAICEPVEVKRTEWRVPKDLEVGAGI
jgi:hypothetical protein